MSPQREFRVISLMMSIVSDTKQKYILQAIFRTRATYFVISLLRHLSWHIMALLMYMVRDGCAYLRSFYAPQTDAQIPDPGTFAELKYTESAL